MTATAAYTAANDVDQNCPKCIRAREINDWVVNSMRAQVERTPDEDMTRLAAWADRVEAGGPERHSEHLDGER